MEESSAPESSMSSRARCASDPRGAALPPVAGEEAPVASSLVNTTGEGGMGAFRAAQRPGKL